MQRYIMKDIKVKQTNLILEKNIEKPTFLYECILENINTKSNWYI